MEIGQQYRRASRDDFDKLMPSRNTVKDAVASIATTAREDIAKQLKRAMNDGGIAATTDTWTDDYRHITYICVVAHIAVVEKDKIVYRCYVLNTSEIDEINKTGIFLMNIFQF